jgi:hypothetical protein
MVSETRYQAKQAVDLLYGETIGEYGGLGRLQRGIVHGDQQQ